MVQFLLPRCADQSMLRERENMAADNKQWRYAHALFRRFRQKTLRAGEANDGRLLAQCGCEEICAETFFIIFIIMSTHFDPNGEKFPYLASRRGGGRTGEGSAMIRARPEPGATGRHDFGPSRGMRACGSTGLVRWWSNPAWRDSRRSSSWP